jgi:DNA-directed RNA polymerase beta' subunit
MGKDWYEDVMARRKAAQIARDKEKERERIDREKVDAIRKLIDTDPQEYNRQMKAHNLRIQRLAAQVDDKSNPVEVAVQGN